MKVAFIGTEIFPDLSHSKSNSRSGVKFFDARLRPKTVVRLPDQKSRFLANSLAIAGNTGGARTVRQCWQVHAVSHQGAPFFQDRVGLVKAFIAEWIEDGVRSAEFLHDRDP